MEIDDFSSADYHVVPPEHHGLELDEYLCLIFPGVTKGGLRRMIRDGRVLVDGEPVNPSHRVRGEQVLILDLDDAPPVHAASAPETPVDVLFEDEHLLIVDKPPGLAVEPERWDRGAATLAGELLRRARADSPEGELRWRPRLCHRLDKDTTGCLAVARDLAAERTVRAAFQDGGAEKRYLALVEGELPEAEPESDGLAGGWTVLDRPLGKDDRKAGRMRVDRGGKSSVTWVRPVQTFRGYSLVECRPLTGRTHQIRVHLADAGFPLAVDPLYGRRDTLKLSELKRGYRPKKGRPERPLIERLTLHARRLVVPSPSAEPLEFDPALRLELGDATFTGPSADGRWVAAEAPLPRDLERVIKQLSKVRPAGR
ncbi:MAG: RluA family pseudouridine synthase [Planctomycetota bacterium]